MCGGNDLLYGGGGGGDFYAESLSRMMGDDHGDGGGHVPHL